MILTTITDLEMVHGHWSKKTHEDSLKSERTMKEVNVSSFLLWFFTLSILSNLPLGTLSFSETKQTQIQTD